MQLAERTDYCSITAHEPKCSEPAMTPGGYCLFHTRLESWWRRAPHEARLALIGYWGRLGTGPIRRFILGIRK